MSDLNSGKYIYLINFQECEKSLAYLEMKYLFDKEITAKYFWSDVNIIPSRSVFIRHRIEVQYTADTLEELARVLKQNCTAYRSFKFVHFHMDDNELEYDDWVQGATVLGNAIEGEPDYGNPETQLGFLKTEGKWLLGMHVKNDNLWKYHNNKPHTNSHSVTLNLAKSLVNIAAGNNIHCTLVDPCCGVGTIVIEAVAMGIPVKGFEINGDVAEKAKSNLSFFGVENVITHGDMHLISDTYDAAIVDIPYGVFTPITAEEQHAIIVTARRIARKVVLVSFEDSRSVLQKSGFTVIDYCQVSKGRFIRHICVCV